MSKREYGKLASELKELFNDPNNVDLKTAKTGLLKTLSLLKEQNILELKREFGIKFYELSDINLMSHLKIEYDDKIKNVEKKFNEDIARWSS